ncbi:hypothetical protein NHX12_025928 [Muraenolepis orangiensis]|uniref:Uncharacterized protein n=1 Tax=Muraenolepis orangiensis TaxID=630683 RepID=A0A9Q0EL84_9TELE|nr:hypothetical protein NHX12_025928 [Muraenolepis orangiensis]
MEQPRWRLSHVEAEVMERPRWRLSSIEAKTTPRLPHPSQVGLAQRRGGPASVTHRARVSDGFISHRTADRQTRRERPQGTVPSVNTHTRDSRSPRVPTGASHPGHTGRPPAALLVWNETGPKPDRNRTGTEPRPKPNRSRDARNRRPSPGDEECLL